MIVNSTSFIAEKYQQKQFSTIKESILSNMYVLFYLCIFYLL